MNIKVIGGTIALVGLYVLLTSSTTKKKNLKLLFVGDSNTDNNYSYADKIKAKFPNIEVKKVAKGGQGTKWMIENLEQDLKNNKYDIITFLGGSNDIYGGVVPLQTTKDNILKIRQMIKDNGARAILVTPPNKKFYSKNTTEKLKNLENLIAWEKQQDFDSIIDFHDMTDKIDLFNPDLRHPNSDAHVILANVFVKSTGIA
jgi:lysophospholipase L1-like esterase